MKPIRILVVDDSRTSLFMETMILRKHHYEVITASDGVEAVDKAAMEQPDLVLMDVVMPHMTGLEACAELRRRPDTRQIPVILCTTRGEIDNVEEGFEAGCDDYLMKPVKGLDVLLKVAACLEARGRTQEQPSTATA